MKLQDVFDLVSLIEENISKEEFIDLYNIVEDDFSYYHVPLVCEETWSHYPKVYFKEFKNNPIRIVSCENPKWKITYEYIITKDKNPLGKVVYHYQPQRKEFLSDDSEYNDSYKKALAFGILSEYCISKGDYEQATCWNNKYKSLAKSIYTEVINYED